MVDQPTPGVPVYTVPVIAGGKTRVLHRNLLLPLQGRIRQQGGIQGKGISSSEDKEEGRDEMPKVARDPQERPRRRIKHKASPTQQEEASGKNTSADLESGASVSRLLSKQQNHSLIAAPFSPEPMSGDEDSSEEEMYTDSLTSHTIASSTIADILTSTASTVEDISKLKSPSVTESQFSPDMPYVEESTQPDLTQDIVFTQQPSDSFTQDTPTPGPPEPPAPRRSARSTKGAPHMFWESVHL